MPMLHVFLSCPVLSDLKMPAMPSDILPHVYFGYAGHETTAAVLTWALFCVVQNPEVEQKLLAEVDTVVGDRAPGKGS